MQYYDDAAGILRSIILSAIAPHRLATAPPQQLVQSPSQEERASHDFAERAATEELPNFLPYAAVDSTDEFEDRCARPDLACTDSACGKLIVCGIAVIIQTLACVSLSLSHHCEQQPAVAGSDILCFAVLTWHNL